MPCPECLSGEVIVDEYDFGACPETGYHDAGERFRCLACGATGDVDDLVANEAAIRSPLGPRNGRAAAGGTMARCRQRQHVISS
jgi:hypothetical protein